MTDIKKYVNMQRHQYDTTNPISSVGNYAGHEQFPYEVNFLNVGGDTKNPLLQNTSDKLALDFGCGTGRMIHRMSKLFKEVHGVDISQNMLDYARQTINTPLYLSSGYDIGQASENKYDFVYSSIAIQHIASRTIRNMIFKAIQDSLNVGGVMSIQMAYTTDTDFIGTHASYGDDKYDATGTNSLCDVILNEKTLPDFIEDLSKFYSNINYHLVNVKDKYPNLNGTKHSDYWATDWIFINGIK